MNIEQERADFEAWHEQEYGQSVGEFSTHGFYLNAEEQLLWKGYQAGRAALQSQDEDVFSPTSLTGLSKDELIRQLQWALNYWMPNIADDGTPDGERAAREAYLLLGMRAPVGREEENTPTYWERVSDLQLQDSEDAFIDGVLLGLQVITGAGNAGNADHDELMRSAGVDLVVRRAIEQEMWELAGLDRNNISIKARRRIEGDGE